LGKKGREKKTKKTPTAQLTSQNSRLEGPYPKKRAGRKSIKTTRCNWIKRKRQGKRRWVPEKLKLVEKIGGKEGYEKTDRVDIDPPPSKPAERRN